MILEKLDLQLGAPGNHDDGDKSPCNDDQRVISWIWFKDIRIDVKAKCEIAESASQSVNETATYQRHSSNLTGFKFNRAEVQT